MEGVKRAKSMTRLLFGTDVSAVNAGEVLAALSGDPRLVFIPADEMYGTTVLRLTVNHGVTKNNSWLPIGYQCCFLTHHSSIIGAAKSLVAMRGLYLNGQTVDADRKVQPEDLIDGRLVIVRAGKDKHAVFTLQS